MTSSPWTSPAPTFTRPDGRPLPFTLRAASRLFRRRPPAKHEPLDKAGVRVFLGRLPEMRVNYPDGREFCIPSHDRMYEYIFIRGEYEPAESRLFRALVRPGDFVVDIGANHGWFSILAANSAGEDGEVWAIEPLPSALAALQENLERNPGVNVRVLPVGVASKEGEIEIHLFEGLSQGHASVATLGRSDYRAVRVPTKTLDELVSGASRQPTIIKLDVEGAELDVLGGAEQLLRSDRPPIWTLEVNYETSVEFGYRPADLLGHLQDRAAHRVYRVLDDGLYEETRPDEAPHDITWLCVPRVHEDRIRDLPVLSR
jgi:FkbM family methyltransferase